ncbi:MAG: YlxM family DNA-binding protein [Bacilli bacterium]
MEELDKNLYVNRLLDLYGELLTEHQKNILELYYHYDLSLSEIAEQEGVSRNAIHDSLKKSIALLENYEAKLNLLQKEDRINKFFQEIKIGRSQEELILIEMIERSVNS